MDGFELDLPTFTAADARQLDAIARERRRKEAENEIAMRSNRARGFGADDVAARVQSATTPNAGVSAPVEPPPPLSMPPQQPQEHRPMPGRIVRDGPHEVGRSTQTTTERTRIDPEARRAFEERQRLVSDEAKIAEDAAASRVRAAQAEAAAAERAAQIAAQREERAESARVEGDSRIAAATAERDAAIREWRENNELKDYFSSRTELQRAMIGVGLALGAFGAALTGTRNYAADILDGAIERDFARQRSVIDARAKAIQMATGKIDEANQWRDAALVDAENRAIAARERAAADLEARLKAQGTSDEEIAKNAAIVALRTRAAEEREKFFGQQNATIRSTVQRQFATPIVADGSAATAGEASPRDQYVSERTGKPASPDESRDDGYATRMTNQLKIIKQAGGMSPEGAQTVSRFLRWQHALPKFAQAASESVFGELAERLSPRDRAVLNAVSEFTRARLRRESGAAITAAEMDDYMRAATRRPGETDADVAAKMQSLRDSIESIAQSSYRPSYHKANLDRLFADDARASGGAAANTSPQAAAAWLRDNPDADPDLRARVRARLAADIARMRQ